MSTDTNLPAPKRPNTGSLDGTDLDGVILVVNPGSSSLKITAVDPKDEVLAAEVLGHLDGHLEQRSILEALDRLPETAAAGVRVVHGGAHFEKPVQVDAAVIRSLAEMTDFAPLHLPAAVAALRALAAARPDLPVVACFDTAFHTTIPPAAATYGLPYRWLVEWGVRRIGFHGLSHAHATRRAGELLGRPTDELDLVTCHLGAGASLAAVTGGRSVDTTMGFTPVDGLVMATRSGAVDPGALLWVMRHHGITPAVLEKILDRESGLAGLSGESHGDLRAILAVAEQAPGPRPALDPDRARLAVDVYTHRLRASIAAMVAALGRLDAVVFTGGVGEASPVIRSATVSGLGFLGLALDHATNATCTGDGDISLAGAAAKTLVVTAREDLQIAREVRATLRSRPRSTLT